MSVSKETKLLAALWGMHEAMLSNPKLCKKPTISVIESNKLIDFDVTVKARNAAWLAYRNDPLVAMKAARDVLGVQPVLKHNIRVNGQRCLAGSRLLELSEDVRAHVPDHYWEHQ